MFYFSIAVNLFFQNAALRRKLQSKTEAVLILSKDLNKCRNERDQFKLLVEELQHRVSIIKRNVENKVNIESQIFFDERVERVSMVLFLFLRACTEHLYILKMKRTTSDQELPLQRCYGMFRSAIKLCAWKWMN